MQLNLKQEILKEYSKENTQRLARYILEQPDRLDELMTLFLNERYRVTQRAAWIVSHVADQKPDWLKPYLGKLVALLKKDITIAVKRNTVRILQFVQIPEKLHGKLADACFQFLQSTKEPIAVKVFSMTILANICKKVPELKHELKLTIEDQMPLGSAGFKNRGNKILKQLQ